MKACSFRNDDTCDDYKPMKTFIENNTMTESLITYLTKDIPVIRMNLFIINNIPLDSIDDETFCSFIRSGEYLSRHVNHLARAKERIKERLTPLLINKLNDEFKFLNWMRLQVMITREKVIEFYTLSSDKTKKRELKEYVNNGPFNFKVREQCVRGRLLFSVEERTKEH